MVSAEAVAAWLKVTLFKSMAVQNMYSLYVPPSPTHTVMILMHSFKAIFI